MYSLRHYLFSPRAPITTGMTTTLTFQTFCNSIIKTWYLSIFSCSLMPMFRSPEIAKSIIWHSICLLIQTMSGDLTSITLSVWILISQRILYLSSLCTYCGLCVCARARVCVCVYVCVCVWTICYYIESDGSYAATSARRSQLCHGVFYIDV